MKIAITGASGFIGSELIPLLAAAGNEVLLVGRDMARLNTLYPSRQACTYAELPERGKSFDMLVHLAAVNNDVKADQETFTRGNVDFLMETVELAKQAGIGMFVNVSTTHVFEEGNAHPYVASKRAGLEKFRKVGGIGKTTFFLPYVYGEKWSGRFSFLNRWPRALAIGSFKVFAALKPTLHACLLSKAILELSEGQGSGQDEIIVSDNKLENPFYRFVFRTLDLGFAIAVIVLFWWLLSIVWLAVRLTSTGPGIFAQERVGRNARVFTCLKFRTMQTGTAQAATHEVSSASLTGIGSFMRRTKLDELPQVFNILKGEMSLIGPRPCLPTQTELIEARRRAGIYAIRPGITGLAQINNIDMRDPDILADWDRRYLRLRSLALDLRILAATFLKRQNHDPVRKD